jgi:hypothetical protein
MAAAGVATILPISINGLGVVEGAFVGSALALGVPYEPALIVAILLRVLLLPYAAVFGLIYAFEPGRPSAFGIGRPAEKEERKAPGPGHPPSQEPEAESRKPARRA